MDDQDLWGPRRVLKLRRGITGLELLAWLQNRWPNCKFKRGEDGISVHALEVRQPPPGYMWLFDDGRNIWKHYVGWLTLSRASDGTLIVDAKFYEDAKEYTADWVAVVDSLRELECGPEGVNAIEQPDSDGKVDESGVESPEEEHSGEVDDPNPTKETRRRAFLFKSLKDEHPDWSYTRVALEATRMAKVRAAPGEQPQEYKWYNVRDAYQRMGWRWERGDKIR